MKDDPAFVSVHKEIPGATALRLFICEQGEGRSDDILNNKQALVMLFAWQHWSRVKTPTGSHYGLGMLKKGFSYSAKGSDK
jgi:hypothetical protein